LKATISYFRSYFNKQKTFPAGMLSCDFFLYQAPNRMQLYPKQICIQVWGLMYFIAAIDSNTTGLYNNENKKSCNIHQQKNPNPNPWL